MTLPEQWIPRFAAKVNTDGPTPIERPDLGPCWVWTASTNWYGYGRIGKGPRGDGWGMAHRFGWEAIHGPLAPGLVIDHLCRNPPCVNPSHLEPVTSGENNIRGDLGNRNGLCRAGLHPWVPENMLHEHGGNGRHRCKPCRNAWDRERHRRRRSA